METQNETNKFTYSYGEINGVEKEKTINKFSFDLPMGLVEVLITEALTDSNGENYYNIYVIDEKFKIEPLNCLKLQELKETTDNPFNFFNEKYCELKAIEHYLWYKYGNPDKDTILSFSILEEK